MTACRSIRTEPTTRPAAATAAAPLPNRGLQPEHVNAIEAFVSEATVPAPASAGPDASEIARRLIDDTA